MTKMIMKLFALTMGLMLMGVPSGALAKGHMMDGKTSPKVELKLAMRNLWGGHIFWVRNVVLETEYKDAVGAKVAEGEVVENAKAIAGAITPYYGKEASDKLFNLLAGHYGAVKEYLNAEGKKEGKDAALAALKKNADEIATFLSSANPNWKKADLLAALVAHGGHHAAQIDEVRAKDFAAEAKTWHAMKKHIYVIADVLSDGIIKQFPDKFRK